MAQDGEGFVARWSRRKQAARTEAEDAAGAATAPEEQAAEAPADDAEEGAPEPPELPPVEELDKDSDFTVFMREGVPEEVRRLALRKLWTTDPMLANLDGLLEYGEDFNLQFRNSGPVATLYRVGGGMPDRITALVEQAVEGEPGADDEPSAEPDKPAETS